MGVHEVIVRSCLVACRSQPAGDVCACGQQRIACRQAPKGGMWAYGNGVMVLGGDEGGELTRVQLGFAVFKPRIGFAVQRGLQLGPQGLAQGRVI